METKVTIPALQKMKARRRKIVGVVAWDSEIAQIADRRRGGPDIGRRLRRRESLGARDGHGSDRRRNPDLLQSRAPRREARPSSAAISPIGRRKREQRPQFSAAVRLAKEGGADMVKVLGDPGV